jgi:iron complex transport system substrate-binding protein
MSKKIMLAVVVILILSLIATLGIFSGCKGQATEESLGSPVEPIVITDGAGDEVILEKPAEKIIVLAISALEIIDAIGGMDRVIGVDNWSVDNNEPLAEGFEGVGDYYGLNIERIAELDPDILIDMTGRSEDDYQKVEELGIEIYRVISVKGIEGVYDEMANISKIVGLEDKGKELVSELKKGVDEIYNQVKDLSNEDKLRVFFELGNDPLFSAGADTFINDLIEKSGGINIVAEDNQTGEWLEYSVETLIEKNPDIIIALTMGGSVVDPAVIKEDVRFSSIDAVINDKVYIVPDNPFCRPNQNLIKALQMLSKAIHPEIFGEFEVIE